MILGEILAEEIHETPGKILAGDNRDATARPLPGPRQDPCQRHLRGRCYSPTCQGSTTVPTQKSTCQQGRHLRGDVQLPGQLSKHLRGGL